MSFSAFHKNVVAGLCLLGSQVLVAQTTSTVPGTTVTTGIVGVTSTQTARLNVLNLQPVIPGVAAVACPATLQFYDDAGALLKQLALTNISPATAASLVLKPAAPSGSVTARAQIRATVFTPFTTVIKPEPGSSTVPAFPIGGCNVMASLEIIDDLTGVTHTFTADLRPMPGFRLFLPAATGR
jgi:hypothetical protein